MIDKTRISRLIGCILPLPLLVTRVKKIIASFFLLLIYEYGFLMPAAGLLLSWEKSILFFLMKSRKTVLWVGYHKTVEISFIWVPMINLKHSKGGFFYQMNIKNMDYSLLDLCTSDRSDLHKRWDLWNTWKFFKDFLGNKVRVEWSTKKNSTSWFFIFTF